MKMSGTGFIQLKSWVLADDRRGCQIDFSRGETKIYITTREFGPLTLKYIETGHEDFSAILKASVEKERREEYEKLKAHFETEDEPRSQCCGAIMHDWPDRDLCPDCKEHTGVEPFIGSE